MDMNVAPQGPPVIGIPASTTRIEIIDVHMATRRYVEAVAKGCGALPFILPALGDLYDMKAVLARVDGLLFTGGRANIDPIHYGEGPHPPDEIRDHDRDATTLPLVRAALDAGVPIFGVCRGIQEINVALGGSLHYRVHEIDGMMDHRMTPGDPVEKIFRLRHHLDMPEGSALASLLGARRVQVNSLHGQGINKLAPGISAEGRAPDGLVEAIRVTSARSFAYGVQWHAEWAYDEDPVSRALFGAFAGDARDRAARRHSRTGNLV